MLVIASLLILAECYKSSRAAAGPAAAGPAAPAATVTRRNEPAPQPRNSAGRSSSTTGGEHHALINVSQNSSSADASFDHQSDNASDGLTEYSFADRNSISEGAESAKPKKAELMPAHLSEMAETVPRMLASIENQEEEKKKAETLVEETKTKRDELQKKIRDQEMTKRDELQKKIRD